jgi:hypothetical protein
MTPAIAFKRTAIVVHRWLGVALCALFLLWFPSGIAMMYWQYPEVSPADRLEHAAALEPSTVKLSPAAALARAELSAAPRQVVLATFDRRPVYRFRVGRDEVMVYADTGDLQVEVPRAMTDRIASAWSGQPAAAARVTSVEDVDQWTLGVRNRLPLLKYSWPDGQDVYVSPDSGDVAQATTTGSRLGAWVGAIPHWLYFTPLRKHGPQWSQVVIWTSAIGTVAALLGLVIGIWMYSPRKRYRYAGAPTSIPYRGQKRWHTIFGLVFGVGAATWAFSGMLSMDPFPASPGGAPGPSPAVNVQRALRGRLDLARFAARDPRQALELLRGTAVKQLEMVVVAGQPAYIATLAGGGTRIVPADGGVRTEFDRNRLLTLVSDSSRPTTVAELRLLDQYDRYYLDRHHERPLPVILARFADAGQTRLYIDPKTARVVGGYASSDWMERWLYHGLHSLDFPWLYAYRPLWDIVVITFMAGGTALCVTSLILAWRVLGRKLTGAVGTARRPAFDDDLVPQAD